MHPPNSLLECSSAGPRPGRLKGRGCVQQQGGSRVCDQPGQQAGSQPEHLVAERLKAEHMGGDGSGGLDEEERGSITVGSCVSRDYTMTMRR